LAPKKKDWWDYYPADIELCVMLGSGFVNTAHSRTSRETMSLAVDLVRKTKVL
jgi:hypothetical protein